MAGFTIGVLRGRLQLLFGEAAADWGQAVIMPAEVAMRFADRAIAIVREADPLRSRQPDRCEECGSHAVTVCTECRHWVSSESWTQDEIDAAKKRADELFAALGENEEAPVELSKEGSR